jgi:hypothetical protein
VIGADEDVAKQKKGIAFRLQIATFFVEIYLIRIVIDS